MATVNDNLKIELEEGELAKIIKMAFKSGSDSAFKAVAFCDEHGADKFSEIEDELAMDAITTIKNIFLSIFSKELEGDEEEFVQWVDEWRKEYFETLDCEDKED